MLYEIIDDQRKTGKGYSGFSKSINAIEAEDEGLYPASKIAKLTKISVDFIKNNFQPKEWHHTSKMYNATPYYSLSEVEEYLEENPQSYKEFQRKEQSDSSFKRIAEWVSYIEWDTLSGKPEIITIENVILEFNGKSTYSFLHNGKKISKRANTKGFDYKLVPTEEEIREKERIKELIRIQDEEYKQKCYQEYEQMLSEGIIHKPAENFVQNVQKFQEGKYWIAVKDGVVVDCISMRCPEEEEFEDFRKQSRAYLSEKGVLRSAILSFVYGTNTPYFRPYSKG